jgi:hypothetical protein
MKLLFVILQNFKQVIDPHAGMDGRFGGATQLICTQE